MMAYGAEIEEEYWSNSYAIGYKPYAICSSLLTGEED
jgi:hypothetical protein